MFNNKFYNSAAGPTPKDLEDIDRYEERRLKRGRTDIERSRAHIRTSMTLQDAYKGMLDSFKSPVAGGRPSAAYADARRAGLLG
jgi:hypothetical protein